MNRVRSNIASDPNCCCDEREELRHIMSEDGRRGEKRIVETCDGKVTKIYLEPEIKKDLVKEIVEEKCPVVCHREIKTYKPDGTVEVVVEDIDNSLKPISTRVDSPDVSSEYATKEDVQELKDALNPSRKQMAKTVSAQNLLEENIKKSDAKEWMNVFFVTAFTIEIGVLAYIIFWM